MLGYYDYGFRWYDPAIGRFTGVDPIADQFAHVSVYNYAENSPIRYIDLWGLQKADPPIFRASFHGALTAGESGFEVNALGAKVGGTVKHGGGDILGINIKADEINGGDISGTRAFSNNEETFGVSGGDVFGGEISITTNTEDGSFVQKSSASLGLFYLKNEYTKDAEGNKDNQQFIGVEFSASAGFILGFDLNLSLEINVSSPDAPEGWESPLDLPTEAPQDNTTVIIPLPINDINEEN